MTVLAFGSTKAAPGVTTSVLALAASWPTGRDVLVVEADPDGGDLAARNGLPLRPNLGTLAAEARHALDHGALVPHLRQLPGGVPALTAPADPGQATRALEMVVPTLAETIVGRDVLVDVGRIRTSSPAMPLVQGADLVIVVAHPRLDELQHAGPVVRSLIESGHETALLLVGEEPYPAEEVATSLGVPVAGVLPHDPRAAAALCGSATTRTWLRRSRLVRAARDLAEQLCLTATHRTGPTRNATGADESGPRPALRQEVTQR